MLYIKKTPANTLLNTLFTKKIKLVHYKSTSVSVIPSTKIRNDMDSVIKCHKYLQSKDCILNRLFFFFLNSINKHRYLFSIILRDKLKKIEVYQKVLASSYILR